MTRVHVGDGSPERDPLGREGQRLAQPHRVAEARAVEAGIAAPFALDRQVEGLLPPAGDSGQGAGLKGNFAAGAFTTLLATPCSAPFLGTAVGFALARGTTEILLVFAALGVGLAMPYLLVAAFPAAVAVLPGPGRWMIILRRLMSLALVLTAVWLLSIVV